MCYCLGQIIFNHPAILKQCELHTMVLFTEPNCWKWLCFHFPSNRLCSVFDNASVLSLLILNARTNPCLYHSRVPVSLMDDSGFFIVLLLQSPGTFFVPFLFSIFLFFSFLAEAYMFLFLLLV